MHVTLNLVFEFECKPEDEQELLRRLAQAHRDPDEGGRITGSTHSKLTEYTMRIVREEQEW